jgi:site-specific DNA-methyltransferase (adenine-specific)
MKMYTVNEVAEVLKISGVRVRQFIHEGRLDVEKKGRDYLILENVLSDFKRHGRKPNGRPRKILIKDLHTQ